MFLKNLEIDFRPVYPNVLIIAMMLATIGILFSVFGDGMGQPKAAFMYNIGFGMAFLTIAATFAKRSYDDKGSVRDMDGNVLMLFALALSMGAVMLVSLDTKLFQDMVIEGTVSGAVGLGTGTLTAFANNSK